jgi:alanine racemase
MTEHLPKEHLAKLAGKQFLLTDSRKLLNSVASVFFAIKGDKHDGHAHIEELYSKGVRDFVVEDLPEVAYEAARFFKVQSTVHALQELATAHRKKFDYPVIGITGSNGKTIVKEWLYQLLSPDLSIIKSPGSYNSQIGVPLSVWGMAEHHQLAIFEAGISTVNEMPKLQKIIRPSIGILTNIGSAHDKGFPDRATKLAEKLQLFLECKCLIYPLAANIPQEELQKLPCKKISWAFGKKADATFTINPNDGDFTSVNCLYGNTKFTLEVPFSDTASLENMASCVTLLLFLKVDVTTIAKRVKTLRSIHMRLELKKGIGQCLLIDDTYNNDLAGLSMALDFMEQQRHTGKKTVILSDMLESGEEAGVLYSKVNEVLKQKDIQRFIGIGADIYSQRQVFDLPESIFFKTPKLFLSQLEQGSFFNHEVILLKGAREFHFEKLVNALQEKLHGTRLEINLEAVTHNLNYYKSLLQPKTKLMVMVKALAYGSSGFEIARLLQYHRVDYLAVAYTDEAVRLRKNGISLPIMVMNPHPESFAQLIRYELEPMVYANELLETLGEYLINEQTGKQLPVHINIDTGMHRLGFEPEALGVLVSLLKKHQKFISVKAVMTHLAGADDAKHQAYSLSQFQLFETASKELEAGLGKFLIKHALNSAGLVRFSQKQFDMVRLGIGLYGIDPNNIVQKNLRVVSALKTTVSQVKEIKKGETIGYSRMGVAKQDMQLATIAIGYADGFDRRMSNGVGKVWIKDRLAPVVGNVCMDMTMVDVSGIEVEQGDEVEVFGENLPVSQLANWINTIPYEVFTSVNERVKRMYFEG